MRSIKMYISNAFYSAGIGLVIFMADTLLNGYKTVNIIELLSGMILGAFIGTLSMLSFLTIWANFKTKPILGFVSNFTVVALIMYITQKRYYPNNILNPIFLIEFTLVQLLSLCLTAMWYKSIKKLNEQLELKKRSLRKHNQANS